MECDDAASGAWFGTLRSNAYRGGYFSLQCSRDDGIVRLVHSDVKSTTASVRQVARFPGAAYYLAPPLVARSFPEGWNSELLEDACKLQDAIGVVARSWAQRPAWNVRVRKFGWKHRKAPVRALPILGRLIK